MQAIKGNYYNAQFNLAPMSGASAVERIIKRKCPADLDTTLWKCPVDYQAIEQVIDSSNKGFETWSKTDDKERIDCINRYKEIVLSKQEQLATALALETGRPLWETNIEVQNLVKQIDEHTQNNSSPASNIHLRPLGPCLIITSAYYPCLIPNAEIVCALLAGNSVIFKPSEKTCYSGQLLVECFDEANFPSGVINLIQGQDEMVKRLLKEKTIKGVFFTGRQDSGEEILQNSSPNLDRIISIGLGGQNTCIIDQDFNSETMIKELLQAAFISSGQRCTSTSIVAIHSKIKDEFIDKFHQQAKEIIIDHPVNFEQEPFMGPLIDQDAVDSYLLYGGMAKRENIEEIMRGKAIEKKFKGNYVTPSIHYSEKYNEESLFLTSEICAPNCTFISYDSEEEALKIANHAGSKHITSIYSKNKDLQKYYLENTNNTLLNFNNSTISEDFRLPFKNIYHVTKSHILNNKNAFSSSTYVLSDKKS